MDKNMEREHTTIKMGTNILEIGSKTKRMEKECWSTLVELSTMDSG